MKAATAVLALLALNCAAQQDWYVVDPAMYTAADQAAQAWCRASEGEFCPRVYDEPTPGAAPILAATRESILELRGHDVCGFWKDNPAEAHASEEIVVVYTLHVPQGAGCRVGTQTIEQALTGTIAHELGHAAGLDDLYGSNSKGLLMYWRRSSKFLPEREDWP